MKGQERRTLLRFWLTAESKHYIIQTECKLIEIWEHMERGRTFLLQHCHQHMEGRAVILLRLISCSTMSTLKKEGKMKKGGHARRERWREKKEEGTKQGNKSREKSFFYLIYTCEDPHWHNIFPDPYLNINLILSVSLNLQTDTCMSEDRTKCPFYKCLHFQKMPSI